MLSTLSKPAELAKPAKRPGPAVASADWTALGTSIRLLVTDPGRLDAARYLLESDLDALDLACSRFRPDSELLALDGADGRRTALSPLLAEAVAVALTAARRTCGDIDPTVGRALAEAGYDRDFARVPAHGPAVTITVHPVPGWRRVEFDRDARTLRMPAGTRLDLGATAKAWAADRAAQRIAERLGCGVLVSLGGDIAVGGPAPAGGWRVRVQDVTGHPDEPAAGPAQTVSITSGGLATSSTTARRWERGGAVLHHIIDPRSSMPVPTVWRTVSVAAHSCVAANTASTCAIIRGRRALGTLAGSRIPARLVDLSGTVTTTGGWPVEAGN